MAFIAVIKEKATVCPCDPSELPPAIGALPAAIAASPSAPETTAGSVQAREEVQLRDTPLYPKVIGFTKQFSTATTDVKAATRQTAPPLLWK